MQEEADEERGRIDSNALEELFRQVSEPCQLEMQQALDNNEEVSDECKAEIQAVIQRTEASRAAQQQNEAPEAAQKSSRWISPTFVTLVFVIAAVGGLAYYIIEQNKLNPPTTRGPRSKKKEERDRRRGK